MDHSYESLESLQLRKSNALVSAKYKSNLVENQIMAIALTRIEENAGNDECPLEAKLYPGELKRLIGDPTNIYKTLKKLSKSITGHTMLMEDGKGNFKAFAVVTNAEYQDGVFSVEFNKNLRPHVIGLTGSYTSYELSVLTGFKHNSSFRLYEVLKSHIYKSRKSIDSGRVKAEYNISELRFMIGLANADDPTVSKLMASMGSNVDWDVLFSKLDKKDRKYESWSEFQRCVIRPAQEELEQKSNIRFDYEGNRRGRRMATIVFSIYPNKPSNPDVIDEKQRLLEENTRSERQMELPYDVFPEFYDEYVGHNNLSKEDIDLLISRAGGEYDLVKSAIGAADKQPYIKNYMGWIVSYIQSGGYEQTEVIEGNSDEANKVNKIKREYEESKKNGDIQRIMWEKTQKKEDFPKFIAMIEEYGVSRDQLEAIYSLDEILQMYADWKCNRDIKF
ncbi:MAG: replication initiation protein [Lachnospiraceae bacterium]|nr:replication initiation protein [Lachnospiraceae bacterium]